MTAPCSRSSLDRVVASFDEGKAAAMRLKQLYEEVGVSLNDQSSLGTLIKRAIKNADNWAAGHFELFDNAALLRGQQLSRIAWAALPLRTMSSPKQHLLDLKRDSLDPWERRPSRGKDKLWELELWTMLNERGIEAELTEPDVVVHTASGPIAIACKRIYSPDNAQSSMSYGVKQLEKAKGTGLLAVNIDDIAAPAGQVLEGPNIFAAAAYLNDRNEAFLGEHSADLGRYMQEGRVSGVMASTCSAIFLTNQERLVDCRQMSFWIHLSVSQEKRQHIDELDTALQPRAIVEML